MELIQDVVIDGERPLFGKRHAKVQYSIFEDGESAVKECRDIEVVKSGIGSKYPFWHVNGLKIADCDFSAGARSALWYSQDVEMSRCKIEAPKMFREVRGARLEDVRVSDADEYFWRCRNVELKDVTLSGGTYPFMYCRGVRADGLRCDSKYVFQYARDVVIENADIDTKDGFWESDNVTIRHSRLRGEYLGWHSRGLTLEDCYIEGDQVLCYADNLTVRHCRFAESCDRMFEYSTVEADICGHVTEVKNPRSGHITADSIGRVTLDAFIKRPADCRITERDK